MAHGDPAPREIPGRRYRTAWFDPRFIIGLVLVVASIGGVLLLLGTLDRTVTVYAAKADLSVGDRVSATDLETRSVRMGSTTSLYINERDLPKDGVVVMRNIAKGELVPASATSKSTEIEMAPVVLRIEGEVSNRVKTGATVDIWVSAKNGTSGYGSPTVAVTGATVVRVIENGSLSPENGSHSVEVLVPKEDVGSILEARANEAFLSLVPVGTPVKGK